MKTAHIDRCKRLRKDETYTEANLWHILRNRQFNGVKFRRQHPIGRYILDFYCPEHKLGIEADGGGHCDDVGKKRDEARTKTLSEYGVRILRFSDLDILNNIEGVYEVICKETER
ncbi:MAG: endonuclease domain-containing protein, partial [Candidatus Omnitrophota bacterium]|nr:endonuclease domain-containing protein [Candidatus Omnitrophota bacterium]